MSKVQRNTGNKPSLPNKKDFARALITLTLGAGLLISISGCVAALVGGAMVGTAVVTSDRRTVDAQAEDTAIELKSVNRIFTLFGDAVHVNVNSYNRKVLLTGEVSDEAAKARIEEEIKSTKNVRSVVNEIRASAKLSDIRSRSSDTLISAKVRSKLLRTPDIYSSSFRVITENGVVYLMGRVSRREAEAATEAVRDVSGVQKVVKVFEYIEDNQFDNVKVETNSN
ncbi:MAG: transporter [Solimicrobium sp.]|jgi:osmotically-inducible protein OsmY|nr:transporter [Solimicrobium sp.]